MPRTAAIRPRLYLQDPPVSARKKQIRQAFRDAVYRRDRHRCAVCGHRPRPEEWEGERPPLDASGHVLDVRMVMVATMIGSAHCGLVVAVHRSPRAFLASDDLSLASRRASAVPSLAQS